MTLTDFIAKKPLTPNDLFGEWKQRGLKDVSDPRFGDMAAKVLSWMRTRVKRAIRNKALAAPKDADCTFKREHTKDDRTQETMLVKDRAGKLIATVVYCAGDFTVSCSNGDFAAISAKAEKKNGRKGKSQVVENARLTPAEKQAATPIELRKGWTNYDLMDEVNARVCEETVKYWNDHNGKVPKHRRRKSSNK